MKDIDFEIKIEEEKVDLKSNINKYNFNINNVIYLDNPHILDLKNQNELYHISQALKNLVKNKSDTSSLIKYKEKFKNELTEIMRGHFEFDEDRKEFIFKSDENNIDMINISSGYKQLGLIQLLLENEILHEKTCLIIDEPTLNLHPTIQIKFAELLVKIAKKLNVILYINTNNPLFIEAIEVFGEIEKMDKKTNFFMCERDETLKTSIKQISKEEMYKIYENLTEAYQILDSKRFENEWNKEFY